MLDRAWRWIRSQLAFLTVLVVIAAGLLYLVVEPGRWARVSGLVAAALIFAGLVRAVLPTPRVGLLAVRGRWVDVILFLALGGTILALDIRLHA